MLHLNQVLALKRRSRLGSFSAESAISLTKLSRKPNEIWEDSTLLSHFVNKARLYNFTIRLISLHSPYIQFLNHFFFQTTKRNNDNKNKRKIIKYGIYIAAMWEILIDTRKFPSFLPRNFPNAQRGSFSDVSSRANGIYILKIAECREIAIDLTAQFFFSLECVRRSAWRNRRILLLRDLLIYPHTHTPYPPHPSTYSFPLFPPRASLLQSRQIHPGNIFTFKRYIFGSKVLPIFRNYNSLLARMRRREKTS